MKDNDNTQALIVSGAPSYAVEAVDTISAPLFLRWSQYIDKTDNTIKTYTKAARAFMEYLQERGIDRPTSLDILEYKRALEGKGLSPSSINGHLAALRQFFSWTESEGLYKNIAKDIKSKKLPPGHKRTYFKKAEFNQIIAQVDKGTLQGKRDRALLAVVAVCGLRDIEVVRANIEDIEIAGGDNVLYVQGKGRDEKAEYQKLKEAEPVLREYLEARGETDKSAPLFPSMSRRDNGERLTTKSVSRIIKGYIVKAGWNDKRHTAHSLRHSAITWALLAGAPIQEVSFFARHRNISTTMIYAHDQTAENNTCADKICEGLIL